MRANERQSNRASETEWKRRVKETDGIQQPLEYKYSVNEIYLEIKRNFRTNHKTKINYGAVLRAQEAPRDTTHSCRQTHSHCTLHCSGWTVFHACFVCSRSFFANFMCRVVQCTRFAKIVLFVYRLRVFFFCLLFFCGPSLLFLFVVEVLFTQAHDRDLCE